MVTCFCGLWKSLYLIQQGVLKHRCLCAECEIVCAPTNHAVNGAEEDRALGGRGALAEVLQHQRAVAEDIDKLPEVEGPHLLQVLPLLVCGGSTDRGGGRWERNTKRRFRGVKTRAKRKRRPKHWVKIKRKKIKVRNVEDMSYELLKKKAEI